MTIHLYKYCSFSLVHHSRPGSTIQYKTRQSQVSSSFLFSPICFLFRSIFKLFMSCMTIYVRCCSRCFLLFFTGDLLLDKRNANKSVKAFYTHTSVCVLIALPVGFVHCVSVFTEIFSVRTGLVNKYTELFQK